MKINRGSYSLLCIIAVALIIRVLGINHDFPYPNRIFYETEEAYTVKTAMAFGSGDLNPHTFNKPSLFYYFLFIFYAFFFLAGKMMGYFGSAMDFAIYYFSHPAVFYLIARILVAILGAAGVYLIYLIGKNAYGYKSGIIAALLLAVAGIHVSYSRYAQVDIPQLFFILLSVYFALKIDDGANISNYIWAGLFAGMAASTKYYGGFAIIIPVFIHFLNKRRFDRRLLSLIILCLAGFILFTPYALLDFKTFLKHITITKYWAQDRSLINEQLPVWAIEYLKDLFKAQNLGLALGLLSICGILYSVLRHTKKDIALFSFILFIYVYFSLANIGWSSLHYLLPAIPLMILLGARLLTDLASSVKKVTVFLPAAVSLFILQPALYDIQEGYLFTRKSTTTLAREWIDGHIEPGSKILMDVMYVPQLTLTEGALERLKNYWSIHANQTGENLREALNVTVNKRSRLSELKDKSLTEDGVPYDIYLIDYEAFRSISDYHKEYGIEYVILSSWVEDIYNSPFRSARRGQANYFYDSVRKEAALVKEFIPGQLKLPGTRIQIFKYLK